MEVDKNADWTGYLVRPKPEWLNPNEPAHPYVVIEDRGPRVLIKLLPQYHPSLVRISGGVHPGISLPRRCGQRKDNERS